MRYGVGHRLDRGDTVQADLQGTTPPPTSLVAPVSLVSINPEGSHNHPARDARALASGRLSPLPALVRKLGFEGSEASNHTPSLADFTTTTPELKFSVHTGGRIMWSGRISVGTAWARLCQHSAKKPPRRGRALKMH